MGKTAHHTVKTAGSSWKTTKVGSNAGAPKASKRSTSKASPKKRKRT